ncbi:hypothetical protein ACPCKW_23765 [Streptomyces griseoincarnatus]
MTTNDVIDGVISTAGKLPAYGEAAANWALANAWWVLTAAAAGVLVWQLARWLLSRPTLRNRSAVEVLPTTGFDPVLEDVLRFAQQLARAQQNASRWLRPARGSAVRVRLMSTGGPLTLRVEGPTRAVSVLRHQGYANCELRAVTGDAGQTEPPKIRLGVTPKAAQPVAAAV